MKIIRPHHTLLALVALAATAALLAFLFPDKGIAFGDVKLRFKPWFAAEDTTVAIPAPDIDAHLAALDSLAAEPLDTAVNYARKESIASLQFANADATSLHYFFRSLEEAASGERRVHVFHYGDSQIESDRMTNVIREKLQSRFGGSGCGLVCPLPITGSGNILQQQSSNWKRYTSYGYDNGKCKHNNYGVLCSFARFTDVEAASSDTVEAWLELRPSSMATSRCKQHDEAVIYFSNTTSSFQLSLVAGDSVISSETIMPGQGVQSRRWSVSSNSKRLRLNFKAVTSPEVYGISLNAMEGVGVSNIALRGNDGGAFRRVNTSSMQPVLDDLQGELFILQFGGNSVPHLGGEASAYRHGQSFGEIIRRFKAMRPNAAIIVVGPSDMSTSIDGVYQTWPYLEQLNEGMKAAAFAEGVAFWDMFSVMGGRNSMISWVNHNPQYAGPDYTHFTPAGARKMAELLSKAILDEYDAWGASGE
jgi:lysophospholipase L1-like esterase